jgi:biotin carboxyl carrier protein
VFAPAAPAGAVLYEGALLGTLVRAGRAHPVVVGRAGGVLVEPHPGGAVEFRAPLGRRGVAGDGALTAARHPTSSTDVPDGVVAVRADTDGTVFLRPAPREPLFVAEGAIVERQATLGLVEVMKTFTPLRAPVAGVVERVLVADGAAVRRGQVLVWVRPAA